MDTRVGIVGFGEAGECFARLARQSGADVLVVDHNVARGGAKAQAKAAAAARIDVRLTGHVGELVDRGVVLSVVAPRTTLDAARGYAEARADHADRGAGRVGDRQLWVDLNSTAPAVKEEVARILGPVGVDAVDGVLVGGGVRLDGDEVPILVAGPGHEQAARLLRGLGLKADALSAELGAASALKMLRSAGIKGFEAQLVETLMGAERYGLVDEVLASLADLFDRIPARSLLEHLIQSHADHCGRRAGEMEMVRDTLLAKDVDPVMTSAAVAVFERSARAPTPMPQDQGRTLTDVVQNLRRGMEDEQEAEREQRAGAAS